MQLESLPKLSREHQEPVQGQLAREAADQLNFAFYNRVKSTHPVLLIVAEFCFV